MNNNILKSFRFEIILYSLLSLLYVVLTIALIYIGAYIIKPEQMNYFLEHALLPLGVVTGSLGIVLFILYFLTLTRKFVIYIRDISEGINEISLGNLDHRIKIKNEDEFAFIADKLNQMAENIKGIMENERRIENEKNELITSVAHDLRTPLTSIIGYLDLVSSKELSMESQGRYIDIAYNKSKRLEKLIDDLFTYTKFNFGEVKATYHEVDLVKLMEQLLEEFYPSLKEYELDVEFHKSEKSAIIMADGDLIARAFENLISNAIKYGNEGKRITLQLYIIGDRVEVSIINYGEMIPEDELKQIFRRFYRIENSRSSETGGTGLGLAIAESIIKLHHGTIEAKSNMNETIFTVCLDIKIN